MPFAYDTQPPFWWQYNPTFGYGTQLPFWWQNSSLNFNTSSTNVTLSDEQKKEKIENNNKEIEKWESQKQQGFCCNSTMFENTLTLPSDAKVTVNENGTKVVTATATDLQARLKESENTINNSIKKEGGSIEINQSIKEYRKNTPWYKRAGRAVCNGVQGVWKLATNFVGYEDGKWNWKKCLKNVGIAAGAIALCAIPGVGPIISTTLLASGVVAGAIGVGKGICKAVNAETTADLDHAYQDIGSGAFIGVTSAFGIKGISKMKPTTVSPRTGLFGGIRTKIAQGGRNLVDAFKPRTWKEAFKNTGNEMSTGFKTFKRKSRRPDSVNGFWKTYGGNLNNSFVKPLKDEWKDINKNIIEKRIKFRRRYGKRAKWDAKKFYQIPFDLVKIPVVGAFKIMAIPFKPWQFVGKTSAGAEYRFRQTFMPEYESYMFGKTLSKEEAETTLAQIKQTRKELEETMNNIDNQIKRLRTENRDLNYA
ncbi:MAG: hypothetical protein MJ230_04250 [bacterium]|nr:hypothetical protein [bacterium]